MNASNERLWAEAVSFWLDLISECRAAKAKLKPAGNLYRLQLVKTHGKLGPILVSHDEYQALLDNTIGRARVELNNARAELGKAMAAA